jgi:hypothetical protein
VFASGLVSFLGKTVAETVTMLREAFKEEAFYLLKCTPRNKTVCILRM